MPYLTPSRRRTLDEGALPVNVGELNYLVTRLAVRVFEAWGSPGFQGRAEIHSALTTAAAEWYRRMIASYEDKKCLENGDVFP